MDWIDPTISTLIRALMARERLPERYVIKGSLFEVIDWIPRLESVIQNGNLQMVKKYHDVRGRGCWPHPRNVLAEGRQLNATDPRDKIYGFLALIHPAFVKNLKPDYEHTVEQVYIDCSISFMQLDQRLDLLSHCNWTSDQTIPSWVPDWNLKSGPSLLEPGISKGIYCAGGVEIFEVVMEVSADKKKLKVLCLKIDSIDSLSINPVHDEEDAQPTQSATQKNHYGDLKGFKEALGRTFLFNRTSDGTIFRSADKLKALFVIPPPKDARHLTLMEGLFYGFIAVNRTLLLAGRPLYKYVLCKEPDGKSDVKWSAPLNSWARNSWEDSLVEIAASNVGNSRLFTTHKGLVGLGPLSSRPEDQVCVLVGCSVPLILRPHENSFKVIGACYTHGLMEGEAFEMLGDGNVKLETIELC